MFTKRVQTLYHPDITTVNKMCQVLGLEPVSAQKVRRNLFGAGSGNVDEVLTNHMQEIADRSSRTWNFDFVREQPLNQGRYVWEKVCCDDTNCSKEDTTCEKENTLLVKVCDDSQVQPKCNNKSWLVQPSIRTSFLLWYPEQLQDLPSLTCVSQSDMYSIHITNYTK
ncbi:uncharacterized protein CDAR_73392 [Caerostris darwini]|uniref:Cyclin-dependent kinase inhibitor domain-containing protein n=1 Tax=Caerostris darwini TaxID=1538125 RepID=A0AAV4VKN5_9ARAC|nr:uncharacterized protein CDAR_73392 [Caerostris darwini]